ncbi:MAG TPA: hypothetical protein VK600_02995 [Candidatus Saccharimonadales bacterium]|nr:hypothetical protein [Candidatus Saccharimonadales bacterium]
MTQRRARLDQLTARWRARHEARRTELAEAGGLPAADADREGRARSFFPWRSESPAEYAARHGAEMIGYTYDAYSYADPDLEAWLSELGAILRARGRRC